MSFGEKIEKQSSKSALGETFDIDDNTLLDISSLAKDFAVSKGICMRTRNLIFDARVPVPFCLLPSTFPQQWFSLAKSIQQDLNYVLHQISHSPKFLKSCLENLLEVDEFTAQLFKIYDTVLREGVQQPIGLGLLRCDYMLNSDNVTGETNGIKQIENNTIATSFWGFATNVQELHGFILERLGVKDSTQKIPENEATFAMARGIVSAWDAYAVKSAVILMIVEEVTMNICDQRCVEFAIYEIECQVHLLRYTFAELHKSAKLIDNRLFVDGKEVAVVYYRTGYVPAQYQPEDWELRLMMERSMAIKCPTAGFHLAGTKTIQLHLQAPGVLEKFLPEDSDADRVRNVFAKQFSLNLGVEGDKAIAMALENPHQFVMKPEREGGGNNIYGDNIKLMLESLSNSKERQAYLLMEKIMAPKVPNYIVSPSGSPKISDILCELGIYGVIIGTKDKVFTNYEAGHILRSKEFGTDEGGIAAGFGALDSPYLI